MRGRPLEDLMCTKHISRLSLKAGNPDTKIKDNREWYLMITGNDDEWLSVR